MGIKSHRKIDKNDIKRITSKKKKKKSQKSLENKITDLFIKFCHGKKKMASDEN